MGFEPINEFDADSMRVIDRFLDFQHWGHNIAASVALERAGRMSPVAVTDIQKLSELAKSAELEEPRVKFTWVNENHLVCCLGVITPIQQNTKLVKCKIDRIEVRRGSEVLLREQFDGENGELLLVLHTLAMPYLLMEHLRKRSSQPVS